jgi:hypothetical protein
MQAAATRLLVVLAVTAVPLLAAPAGAGAQGGGGLCEMQVFPTGQGFSLGPHTVQVRMICEERPGSDYSYEGLRISSSLPIAEFASLEVGTCSVGTGEVECTLLLGGTNQAAELHGDLRFLDPTCSPVDTTVGAEYLLVGGDGSREWYPMPVKGPCVGEVAGEVPGPKGCVRDDFRARVNTDPELRSWLLEAFTFGGEVSDEIPQYIVRLERQGRKAAREPRLPDLKYKSNLTSFIVKVPASRLARGKYLFRVFLELNDPRDFPSSFFRFKRC